jgi:hypothetical protein
MLKPPDLPWPIRLAVLAVAAGLSLYVLELYDSGARLVAAIGALTAAAPVSPPAVPPQKSEPGLVSVSILPASKKTP